MTESSITDIQKPFKCSTCWQAFSDEESCYNHMLTHLGQATEDNATKLNLEWVPKQRKIRTTAYKPRTKCKHCGQECGKKLLLKEHEKTHQAPQVHTCDTCGKTFSKLSVLVVHKRSHTGERPFQCNYCGKTLVSEKNLNTHLRMHTREHLVPCQECGKEFATNILLRVHMISHSTEKPFECEICAKKFKLKDQLRKHSVVHRKELGLQALKCPNCSKPFYGKDNLNKHIKRQSCFKNRNTRIRRKGNEVKIQESLFTTQESVNEESGKFINDVICYSPTAQDEADERSESSLTSGPKLESNQETVDRRTRENSQCQKVNKQIVTTESLPNQISCSSALSQKQLATFIQKRDYVTNTHKARKENILQIALPQSGVSGPSHVQFLMLKMK